jgi:hypothetical protein
MINLLSHTENAINRAESLNSKLPEFVLNMEGMSSWKIRILLNELCNFKECKYLEIGSYTGSTFCSALYNNPGEFTSIDYWPNKQEFDITRNTFKENLGKTLSFQSAPRPKTNLIDEDCFKYKKKDLKNKINIYLYDGDHSFQSQRDGLIYYDDILEDEFVLLVDDNNSNDVWNGTLAAFNYLQHWKIKKHWILPGLTRDWKIQDSFGYWNGFFVAVVQKIK